MNERRKRRTVYIWGEKEVYRNYQKAIESVGGQIYFGGDSSGCDALLLPGGGDMDPRQYGQNNQGSSHLDADRDKKELELLGLFVRQRKPVLGICRGLQVINVFFGGTLIQDLEGHCAVAGTDRYHRTCIADAQLEWLFGAEMIVNSAHHQGVDRIGAGLTAIQWAPDGVIEAIRHKSLPVWAVQWHPERLLELTGDKFFRFWLNV